MYVSVFREQYLTYLEFSNAIVNKQSLEVFAGDVTAKLR